MHVAEQAAHDVVVELVEQVSLAAREAQLRDALVVCVHHLGADRRERRRRRVARPARQLDELEAMVREQRAVGLGPGAATHRVGVDRAAPGVPDPAALAADEAGALELPALVMRQLLAVREREVCARRQPHAVQLRPADRVLREPVDVDARSGRRHPDRVALGDDPRRCEDVRAHGAEEHGGIGHRRGGGPAAVRLVAGAREAVLELARVECNALVDVVREERRLGGRPGLRVAAGDDGAGSVLQRQPEQQPQPQRRRRAVRAFEPRMRPG